MKRVAWILCALGVVAGCVLWLRPRPAVDVATPWPLAKAQRAFHQGDYDSAKQDLTRYVAAHEASPDPNTQDVVTQARLRLGHIAAKQRDFSGARQAFLMAEEKDRGTGMASLAFGNLKDQAAYQAIACLMAEHKNAQATKELEAFIQNRWQSPLIHGAYQRLIILDQGKPTKAHEALIAASTERQNGYLRQQAAMCGPRALEWLLSEKRLSGAKQITAQELAKAAQTTDEGTTMDGMRLATAHAGLTAYAYQLSRPDFALMPKPALWLADNHYVAVTKIQGNTVTAYDPMVKAVRDFPIPEVSDKSFSANVLTFLPIDKLSDSGAQP